LKEFDRQVHEIEIRIVAWHRMNDDSRKLAKLPGTGPITASAMVASIGDAKSFRNGRQVSAWLGLVPKQNSTGGKTVLLGMSKVRTLLIQGARSVIYAAQRKERPDGWPMPPTFTSRLPEFDPSARICQRSVARWALTKAWHVRFRLDFRRLTSRPTLRRSFTIEALAIHRGPTFLNEGSA